MTEERLASFRLLCAPAGLGFVITARRARALGIEAAGPVGLAIGDLHDAAAIFSLASDAQVNAASRCRSGRRNSGRRDRAGQARAATAGLARGDWRGGSRA